MSVLLFCWAEENKGNKNKNPNKYFILKYG
jgi:hypothetical protein